MRFNRPPKPFPNRFPAPCQDCRVIVQPGDGLTTKTPNGYWIVRHADPGTCAINRGLAEQRAAAERDQHKQPAGYPDVPAGYYAVPSQGLNDLDFYRVKRPTKGKWIGYTFVDRVIGGHPDKPVKGAAALQALHTITFAGPDNASAKYGQELGQCGRCNRHLTDEESRIFGIGPECRKVIGLAA